LPAESTGSLELVLFVFSLAFPRGCTTYFGSLDAVTRRVVGVPPVLAWSKWVVAVRLTFAG